MTSSTPARTDGLTDLEVVELSPEARRTKKPFVLLALGSTPSPLRRSRRYALKLLLPLFAFVACMFAYPAYVNLKIGFENVGAAQFITHTGTFDGLANYRYLFTQPVFYSALAHTALFAAITVPLQLIFGFGIAVLLNRPTRLYTVLRAVLLIPWLLPLIVTGNIWIWMLDQFYGVFNFFLTSIGITSHYVSWLSSPQLALWGVIIANTWLGIPFALIILSAGLRAIPDDLYESAALDGAGAVRQHRYITVPLLSDVIAIFVLLGLVFSIKIFDIVYIMTGGGPANSSQVLGTLAYDLAFQSNQWGDSAAVSNVMLVLALALSIVYVRVSRRRGVFS